MTIGLPKSIARRLRNPGPTVAASLTLTDASAPRTLAVNLSRADRSHKAAHTASRSTNGFWDNTVTACDRRDIGDGLQGSVGAGVPPLDYVPPPGGWMWFQWRSWLFVWDGNNDRWSTVEGLADGSTADGSNGTVWSYPSMGWLDESRALLIEGIGAGSQSYTVRPGHNVYTVVAAQSWYADTAGRWYGGEIHWEHQAAQASPGGLSYGEFCYFP